jgi:pimeloyl-ACP methyl ester carboxylesterase
MSHMPPVRPDDASPIPDPVRSRPAGAMPKRPNGHAADPTPVATGNGARRSSAGGLGLAALAAATGALVAGVAAARRLGRDTPPLYRSLRATPKEWWWSGFKLVYYEDGPRGSEPIAEADVEAEAADPIVLIHSIHAAASAWEMRELFERFGVDRRVIALDLLGFGASERPDVDYDSDLYQDMLRDFLTEVVGGPAHVLASSVSAAHALESAAADPKHFKSLILVNPTGLLTQATGPDRKGRLLQNLVRLPFIGEALYNLLVSKPSLRYYGSRIYRDPSVEEQTSEQQYATAHQPGARYAPAAFLGDAMARNVYMALRTVEVPTLSFWTRSDITDTEREAEAFKAVAPGMQQIWIDDAGSLPHEEKPDIVTGYIRGWLRKHEV